MPISLISGRDTSVVGSVDTPIGMLMMVPTMMPIRIAPRTL